MPATGNREHDGPFTKIAAWWREMRRSRAAVDELQNCGAEAEQLARDVGLSAPELRVIAAKRPDAAQLLQPRLKALGIDRASVSREQPQVLRDLERVCTLCGDKMKCAHDLATNSADPRWRDYCPNVQTLDALRNPTDEAATLAPSRAGRFPVAARE